MELLYHFPVRALLPLSRNLTPFDGDFSMVKTDGKFLFDIPALCLLYWLSTPLLSVGESLLFLSLFLVLLKYVGKVEQKD